MGKRSPWRSRRTPWSPRSLRRTSLTSSRELYRHGRRAAGRWRAGIRDSGVPRQHARRGRGPIPGTSTEYDDERRGRRRCRHSGPNTDPSLRGWGENVVVPENAPIITYGVGSRAMLVSGARHHYGNTETGRLSDATTRRRRTERADTADVTATPPSARQEHFASDLRSWWSGPGGHGRGVPSIVIGMWRRRSAALPPAPRG
jgi:hypothetical protein